MLHLNAVEPRTLSLLNKFQKIPELNSFYLVGGTALALKFGHRISIDIDLFGKGLEKEKVIAKLKQEFGKEFEYENTPDKWALFCYINKIKVEGLGKEYIIGHKKESDLRNAFGQQLDRLFRGNQTINESFWALKDINFEIKQGEMVMTHRKKSYDL